jgi:hypothetical protein
VTTRLPAAATLTRYASVTALAAAMRRAGRADQEHEKLVGGLTHPVDAAVPTLDTTCLDSRRQFQYRATAGGRRRAG